jgi:hypothetical protein
VLCASYAKAVLRGLAHVPTAWAPRTDLDKIERAHQT